MKVRLKPVKSYELLGADGRTVARLAMVDSWEGMAKLQTESGQTLIVDQLPSMNMEQIMAEAFGSIFGADGAIECDLLKASPILAAELMGTQGDPA